MMVPLWVLIPVCVYLTGVVAVARLLMPWVRSVIRVRANEWGVDAMQVRACESMSASDMWWVAVTWPMLLAMWFILKVAGLFGRKS